MQQEPESLFSVWNRLDNDIHTSVVADINIIVDNYLVSLQPKYVQLAKQSIDRHRKIRLTVPIKGRQLWRTLLDDVDKDRVMRCLDKHLQEKHKLKLDNFWVPDECDSILERLCCCKPRYRFDMTVSRLY